MPLEQPTEHMPPQLLIAEFFPDKKCFGYLLAQEIESIEKVMKTGEKPVLAILGGAKVSSKITIIENILDKVDHLIIGGGMAFTFVKAQGGNIGDSICEDDKMDLALGYFKSSQGKKCTNTFTSGCGCC